MKGLQFLVFLLVFVVSTSCAQQKKYITYTVQKGETMKSIAKKLNIKTKDLLRLNPDAGRKPSASTIIIIPNKNYDPNETTDTDVNKKDIVEPIDSTQINIDELKKHFVIHKVKKGDTFYSLTRFYNVSQTELDTLNPALVDGLKLDMILKIKAIEAITEELAMYRDTIQEDTKVRLAMLLPFRAYRYDTIDGKDIFKTNTLANITTDLYLGASVAVDSLQKQGVDIDIKLFDTGRKNKKIRNIVAENDLDAFDAIVGPLYSDEVPAVTYKTKTPIVFPVYSKKQTSFVSSRVVKTYADKEVHQKALMDYIFGKYTNENVLIIGDSSAVSVKKALDIQAILKQHDSVKVQHDTIQSPKIIHASNGYIPKHLIINSLRAEVANWVVFATDNNVIASDAVNSLISLPTEEPEEEEEEEDDKKKKKKSDEPEMQILPEDTLIKIFAFDKNTTYDKVDNNKLAKLGFTYTSDVFVDETSPLLQQFIAQYVQKNNAYPSYYATKGFDIVYDLGMRLASGKDLKDTFKDGASHRIESKFDYSNELFKTSGNNGLFILQYNPDLTITRIK